jgi:tRNA(fMet)-specific endonuclease VapC
VETSGIIVDTDIIIDYLKKAQPGADILKKHYLSTRINITSITLYELLCGVQKSGNERLINRLLRYVTVVPLDEASARKAAALHYALKCKGMDIGVKDSLIAGICEAHKLPLLTRNIKHFSRVPGIKLLPLK